jgi:hypothetical protein
MGSRAVAVAVALVAVLALAAPGSASHFRFGSLSWEPRDDLVANNVDFTLTGGFRRCGYSGTAADGCPAVGDTLQEFIGFTQLFPGDGMAIGGPLQFEVTSVNPIQDWLLGTAEGSGLGDPDGVVAYQYHAPNSGGEPWVAAIDSCCRIGTFDHINNRNGNYRVETLVDLAVENRSPRSALPPIVSCELGTVCRFVALALDPDGDPLRWRLSDPCEAAAGCGFTQPGPPHAPNALTVDPEDGLVRWDTTGASISSTHGYGLYSTQITIEDLDEAGAVKSKTAVDFFIRVAPVPPFAPRFETPPTPADGATLRAGVGEELEFEVVASDPDAGDVVTIGDLGLPDGMSCVDAPSGDEAVKRCSWEPDSSQRGSHLLVFTATDSFGLSAVRSFEVSVEDERFLVNLTTFIPGNHVQTPFGCTRPRDDGQGSEHLFLDVRTDDRGFDPDAETYRTRQLVVVEPDEDVDEDGFVSAENTVRPTRAYARDALLDGFINDADDDGVAGDCRLFHQEASARPELMDVVVDRLAEDVVMIRLAGGPGQPLFPPFGRPEINWELTLIVDATGPRTRWVVVGEHDGFPAYELYLKGERIYEYWPGDPPYDQGEILRLLLPPLDVSGIAVEGELDD